MSNIELYDNTRISSHRNCPRKFYWRHVRHFTPITTRAPLVFGSCWHAAMDAVWKLGCGDNSIDNTEIARTGYAAFCYMWEIDYKLPLYEAMSPDQRDEFGFRHDETAYHMLMNYVEQRREWMRKMTLIEVEKPFAVPVDPDDPNLFYVGRLDKVVEWDGRVWVLEHKTTSMYRKNGYFSSTWVDSFSPNSQVDGYLHALHMLFGDRAKGVMIDAALVHKTVHEGFMFIPIERGLAQLDAWLWEALYQIRMIQNDMKFAHEFDDAAFMPAFPKNTNRCIDFNSQCAYLDLCKFVANPATIQEAPQGFAEEKWEPFKELGLSELFKDQIDD